MILEEDDDDTISCSKCGGVAVDKRYLSNHISEKHGDNKCIICDFICTSIKHLQGHLYYQHSIKSSYTRGGNIRKPHNRKSNKNVKDELIVWGS